jgi:peptidoglycan/LPS O-acetylase OafA/YrhL
LAVGTAESIRAAAAERRIAAAPQSRERFYLPELDTLRFFAFFCVFAFHLAYSLSWGTGIAKAVLAKGVLPAGAFGVDLFFTLSAFLITKLLLQERAKSGKIHFLFFYARRALRIWPLYFFFLAAGSILAYYDAGFRYSAIEPRYLLLMAIFVGNFAPTSWWGSAFVLSHLWSVSVEEQFYLLWPMTIREASERKIRMIAVGLLVVASVARAAAYLANISPLWMWTCTFTRLEPFAIGILLATVPHTKLSRLCVRWRTGLLLAAIATWAVARYFNVALVPRQAHPGLLLGYPLAAVGSGAFLLSALGAGGAGVRLVTNAWLVYLGRISYGLYVYHLFAMIFTSEYVFPLYLGWLRGSQWPLWVGWLVYVAFSFSLTVLLAAASYRWLESPFLRLKNRFTYIESRPV